MIFIRMQKVLWNLSATLFSTWVLFDMMLWSEFETLDEAIGNEYDVVIGKPNFQLIIINVIDKILIIILCTIETCLHLKSWWWNRGLGSC